MIATEMSVKPYTAVYNLHDDRLKLFIKDGPRLPDEEYREGKRIMGAYWRGSGCLTGVWNPAREDFCLRYAEEIDFIINDDNGLSYRLERFGGYSDNAQERAEAHQQRVNELIEHIPMGQPILVGHHSERMARRAQKQIDSSQRQAIYEYDKADYWGWRQERAEKHAKFKEDPAVIRRRIEGYEKQARDQHRAMGDRQKAEFVVNLYYHGQDNQTKWPTARAFAIANEAEIQTRWANHVAHCQRWLAHLDTVIEYQRELYTRSGGVPFDQGIVALEEGGAIQNWKGYWVPILKVNPQSVTIPEVHNWSSEHAFSHVFTRTVKKADIAKALTKAEYEAHPHHPIGQKLITGMAKMHEPKVTIEKGGLVMVSYRPSGGSERWYLVDRVNSKTVSARAWSTFSGKAHWYDTKVEIRNITKSMTKAEWQALPLAEKARLLGVPDRQLAEFEQEVSPSDQEKLL